MQQFTRYLIVYDFSCYIVYPSFINSSSKNSSVEVEFYQKKKKKEIIKQHFSSRKSRKVIRKEMRMFETRNL